MGRRLKTWLIDWLSRHARAVDIGALALMLGGLMVNLPAWVEAGFWGWLAISALLAALMARAHALGYARGYVHSARDALGLIARQQELIELQKQELAKVITIPVSGGVAHDGDGVIRIQSDIGLN